jgi:uncharacterized membrane-anchored protein YjiN (DUF445 family)
MKAGATGLLAFAAAVYVATLVAGGDGTAVGYVRAASEAAMVGGLADWFAVTALFRHPLGLPVPHTALVPTKKDQLAANLGEFMTEHFLTRETIRDRLAGAAVVPRVGGWLADPAHARTVTDRALTVVADLLDAVDDAAVVDALLELAGRDALRRSYGPLAGRLLEDTVRAGTHRPLVDVLVEQAYEWLRANRELLAQWLKETAANAAPVVGWMIATDKRTRRAADELVRLAREVRDDPHHELRRTFDDLLLRIAADVRHDAGTAERIDAMVVRFLASDETRAWAATVLAETRLSVRAALLDPASALSRNAAGWVADAGRRAVEDDAFRARLEAWVEGGVLYAVDRYAGEFTRLVEATVASWDGRDAADRIENAVGHDLQFIRVNGTVVGALAGVAIHTVALLLA